MNRHVIERHPLVRRDLLEIARFIGDYSGYDVAEKKIRAIERAIVDLVDFPNVGTIRDDIAPGLRAIPAAEKAVICFVVDSERSRVRIVCVSYAGQNWHRIARGRGRACTPP